MRNNNIIILASIIGFSFMSTTVHAGGNEKNPTAAVMFYDNAVQTLKWTGYCEKPEDKINVVYKLIPNEYVKFLNATKTFPNRYTVPTEKALEAKLLFEKTSISPCPAPKAQQTATGYVGCDGKPSKTKVTSCPAKDSTKPDESGGVYDAITKDAFNKALENAGLKKGTVKNEEQDKKKTEGQTNETVTKNPVPAPAPVPVAPSIEKKTAGDTTTYTYKTPDGKDSIEVSQKTVPDSTDPEKTKTTVEVKKNGVLMSADETKKALASLPEGAAKNDLTAAVDGKSVELDEEGKKKENAGQVAADKTVADLTKLVNAMDEQQCPVNPRDQTQPEPICAAKVGTVKTDLTAIIQKINTAEKNCINRSELSDKFCSVARNDNMKKLSVGLAGISSLMQAMPGAAQVCKTTSSINLIGQSVVIAASLTCEGFRAACGLSCGRSTKLFDEVMTKTAELKTVNYMGIEPKNIGDVITKEVGTNVDPRIAQCKEHALDVGAMIASATGMLSAHLQAKACEQQLAALDSTNNTAQLYTMDEMCAQAQNVNSTVCKCRSDNTAVGCPGYIAGSGNEGNINKDLNAKGTSNMAGLSYGSKITPSGTSSGLNANLDGLGDEAKKALAAGGDQKQDGSMFGSAGGASAGGGGSTGAGAGGVAGADKGKLAEEPKSIGSSFMNAVGSLFGKGGSSGKTAPSKDDKFASDKYKEQIKRQIAAEQMRSEVSSASGMDNWTKIRTRYKSTSGSLIDSN